MELSSAPLHKGQLPWRGLLLAASLLIYWSSPTTAQVSVEAVPPHVAEGENVLLLVHNLPETPRVFYWYKGENTENINEIARFIVSTSETTTGPAYSGRETIYPNGSLLFQNVTQNDTRVYMLQMLTQSYDYMKVSVQFHVHQPVTAPSIQVNNTTVKEMDSVSLTCSSNDTGISIHWLFNGESLRLTDRMKLSLDNSTLSIDPVRKEDSGKYQCEVSNSVSSERSDPIQLDIIEPVTKPSIQVSNTKVKEMDSVSLTCSSNDTGISIHWLFNGESLRLTDRMKLSLDNSTLSIDPVRKEDSGKYQCEVSNAVSSERSDPIQLDIIADPTQGNSGLPGGATASIVMGSVAWETLIAALACFLCF